MRRQKDRGRILALVLCDDCYVGLTQCQLRDLFRQFGGQEDGLKQNLPAEERRVWQVRATGDANPRARASDLVYAEHFQPVSVLLDLVPEQVGGFDLALRFVAIREID